MEWHKCTRQMPSKGRKMKLTRLAILLPLLAHIGTVSGLPCIENALTPKPTIEDIQKALRCLSEENERLRTALETQRLEYVRKGTQVQLRGPDGYIHAQATRRPETNVVVTNGQNAYTTFFIEEPSERWKQK
jgi:hypothetical protein